LRWKIEVSYKSETPDVIGQGILEDIADLGVVGVTSVHTAQIYWIEGKIDSHTVERICSVLLADPVTQRYVYREFNNDTPVQGVRSARLIDTWTIEIRFKAGVTDAVADSVLKGIRDSGTSNVQSAQTGKKYWIQGDLDRAKLETIAQRLLANEVIQTFEIRRETGEEMSS
jgi:phosphoribosylformylglycinamidine (FGAM) synthase PurS component